MKCKRKKSSIFPLAFHHKSCKTRFIPLAQSLGRLICPSTYSTESLISAIICLISPEKIPGAGMSLERTLSMSPSDENTYIIKDESIELGRLILQGKLYT